MVRNSLNIISVPRYWSWDYRFGISSFGARVSILNVIKSLGNLIYVYNKCIWRYFYFLVIFFNSYCNYCVYQWFFFYNNSCFVSSAHNFYTSNIVLQIHEKNVLFFKNRFIWLLDWHFLNLRSSSIGRNIGSLSHSITPVIKTIFFSKKFPWEI